MKTESVKWTLGDLYQFEHRRFVPFDPNKHTWEQEIKVNRTHSVSEVFDGTPEYQTAEYRIRVEPMEDTDFELGKWIPCRQIIYKITDR